MPVLKLAAALEMPGMHCIDVLKEKFAKAFVAEKNYALHVKARRNMVGTSKRKVTAETDDFADTF